MTHPNDELSIKNYLPLEKLRKYQEIQDYSLQQQGKEARYWEIWSLIRLGQLDEALEKGLSYGVHFKEGEWKGHYLNLIGRVYANRSIILRTDEWDLALQYQEWAYQVRIEIGDLEFIGFSLHRIGATYMMKGELDRAIEYFKQSLIIAEDIGHDHAISFNLADMGMALISKGEIDEAKKCLVKSLEIDIKLGFNPISVKAMLGLIYHLEGDFDKAVEYFQSLYKFDKGLGNQIATARDIVFLITVEIQRDREKAKKYLDELEEIEKIEQNKSISLRFKYASALYLKSSNRSRDKAKSELLFEEIINSDSEFVYKSITHLVELLLVEYKTYMVKEVLDEILMHLETLKDKANKNSRYPVLIKSLLIKSQLEMIEGKFEETAKILSNARELAEEKNLKMLLQEVVDAQDSMVNELQNMKILIQKNATIAQRLEKSSIMSYIEKAQKLIIK